MSAGRPAMSGASARRGVRFGRGRRLAGSGSRSVNGLHAVGGVTVGGVAAVELAADGDQAGGFGAVGFEPCLVASVGDVIGGGQRVEARDGLVLVFGVLADAFVEVGSGPALAPAGLVALVDEVLPLLACRVAAELEALPESFLFLERADGWRVRG